MHARVQAFRSSPWLPVSCDYTHRRYQRQLKFKN